MMKKLFLLIIVLGIQSAFATPYPEAYNPAPYWCVYGTWNQGSVTANVKESSNTSYKFDFSKLAIANVPDYILVGSPITVKGDGLWFYDKNDTIYFYDSIRGYLGKTDTNFEGNAYFTYTPNTYAGYKSQMWVMKNLPNVDNVSLVKDMTNRKPVLLTIPPCSKKDVYFQNKPFAGPAAAIFDSKNPVPQVQIYYELDLNSKAMKEHVPATISVHSVYAKGGETVSKLTVSEQRGTVWVSAAYLTNKGKVTFDVDVNDGSYTSDRKTVGSYTPTCIYKGYSWTYQTGPGTSGDPNGTTACGYDVNGNACPASIVPLSPYSYPNLKYTCL